MSEVLKLEISTICIVHIITIILAIIFFMIFYMKANKNYLTNTFLLMQISIIGWLVFKIFKTVSPTETSRWWFIVGYYFCACVFQVAFLEFTYTHYKGKPLSKRARGIIYIFPLIQFLFVLTNPLHYYFYASYNFRGDSFGILFYLHTTIIYTFIMVGAFYGYCSFKAVFKNEKSWYKIAIACTIIIPFIINILFITKILHRFIFLLGIPVIFDITPIVFVFSTSVYVYAIFNHNLINLSPIMRHEFVDKLDTSICVLDSALSVIYVNEKLSESIGSAAIVKIQNSIKEINYNASIDDKKEIEIDGQLFSIEAREVNSFKEKQYIATLNNITDFRKIEKGIVEEQNSMKNTNIELEKTIEKLKKTSKIGARNYIARELHDIIGHSLVVTIKLLEVSKLYYKDDRELSKKAVDDSVLAIKSGIDSMLGIVKTQGYFTGKDLKINIQNILEMIQNTKVNTRLNLKGEYYNLKKEVFYSTSKIIKELVTNTLKYSDAKEIFISINIKKTQIDIMVIDNGKGCNDLIEGNGLKGINKRLELIDGRAEFVTSKNEGFMSKIVINTS